MEKLFAFILGFIVGYCAGLLVALSISFVFWDFSIFQEPIVWRLPVIPGVLNALLFLGFSID